MAGQWLLGSFLVVLLIWKVNCQSLTGPPVISGSYKAIGEMVETLEDESQLLTQIAFEETYDEDRQQAAFRVWMVGQNVTFIEHFKTNQTFQFNGTDCTLEAVEEWIKTKSPPSLLAYEDTNGTVRFSLKQLFALDNKYLKESNVSSSFRGIPANKWMYEIRGTDPETKKTTVLNVYAYWSDGTWSTSSSHKIIPLGYIVTRMNFTRGQPSVKIHEQFINVFGFAVGIADPKLLEPIQGVMCEKRKQTLEFPNVSKMQAISVHSELVLPDELEIRYMDTWLDAKNKIVRVDLERIDDEAPVFEDKTRKYQSEIAIAQMGIVYRWTYDKGLFSCKIIPFKDYTFDVQTLFNIRLQQNEWDVAKLFGRNQTTYVYIGKTSKRDIPCHMFQGFRTDWPEPSAQVESIWEWCFSENMTKKDDIITFRNGEYGLIHAQFRITKSGNQVFYPGLRMIHHFYDVNKRDPAIMQATNFDISLCFGDSDRRDLQFAVDWMVSDDNKHQVENATSDTTFLQKWKNAIYRFSGLEPYSLRITKLHSTTVDKKLYVKFFILNPHPDLPKDIKKSQKTAFEAENTLRDNINNGKVFISYMPAKDAKMLKLQVLKHSLEFQLKREFIPHSTSPLPSVIPTSSSRFPFSLITDPDDDKTTKRSSTSGPFQSTTSGQTNQPTSLTDLTTPTKSVTDNTSPKPKGDEHESGHPGHGPGAVAGVSIAMLLVGISIGSAGIFVKINGMPSCMKT